MKLNKPKMDVVESLKMLLKGMSKIEKRINKLETIYKNHVHTHGRYDGPITGKAIDIQGENKNE